MKFRFTFVIILAIVASPVAQNSTPLATSPKRAITEKDLFDFIWVANPQLSPDGSRVAFTRVRVDEKRTGYETSIWTVATSGSEPPFRMTNGQHDAQPRWSPDGKRIAFTRGGDKTRPASPSRLRSQSCRSPAGKPGSSMICPKALRTRSGRPTVSA